MYINKKRIRNKKQKNKMEEIKEIKEKLDKVLNIMSNMDERHQLYMKKNFWCLDIFQTPIETEMPGEKRAKKTKLTFSVKYFGGLEKSYNKETSCDNFVDFFKDVESIHSDFEKYNGMESYVFEEKDVSIKENKHFCGGPNNSSYMVNKLNHKWINIHFHNNEKIRYIKNTCDKYGWGVEIYLRKR